MGLHWSGLVNFSFQNKTDRSWSRLGAQKPNNWTGPDLQTLAVHVTAGGYMSTYDSVTLTLLACVT